MEDAPALPLRDQVGARLPLGQKAARRGQPGNGSNPTRWKVVTGRVHENIQIRRCIPDPSGDGRIVVLHSFKGGSTLAPVFLGSGRQDIPTKGAAVVNDRAALVVDEGLYLQATKTLGGMEGGEEKFDIAEAIRAYARERYIAGRFKSEVGRDIDQPELHAIENYIAGIYSPEHHNLYFEGIGEHMREFAGPTADVIRSVVWAFLTAWVHRYGGLNEELRVRATLIDPTAR